MAQSIALRSMPISNMALTAALVARVERKEPDPGPHYGNFDLSEETRERWLRLLLEGRTPDTPFWVFSYGSHLEACLRRIRRALGRNIRLAPVVSPPAHAMVRYAGPSGPDASPG
ncbi:hypothetical protein X737_33635 [Mesorhizobium sp. L48C026A00]|nr:hypothetical protein X737_33635 [Mesorhizobium sp. L48C026A00]